MGEVSKCPVCKSPLNAKRYCYNCLRTFPEEIQNQDTEGKDDIVDDDINDNATDSCNENNCNMEETVCPKCGAPGQAGEKCFQCQQIIPDLKTDSNSKDMTSDFAYLSLCENCSLQINDNVEYIIGRESCTDEIKKTLHDNNYVSRKHCAIKLDLSNRRVFVKDCGSTNGTFVCNGKEKITEERAFNLPVNIWLGTKPNTRVEINIKL